MDATFDLDERDTEERAMLRAAAARWVERDDARGSGPDRWQAFAEMGWLALGVPEDCGGLGDAADAEVVAHALGRANASEPWLANVGLAAPLLAALRRERLAVAPPPDEPAASKLAPGGTHPADRCGALLARLAAGDARFAVAAWEPQGRYDAFDVATRATSVADGWRLDGTKTLVLGGDGADLLLVVARVDPGRGCADSRGRHDLGVFEVAADATGLVRRGWPTYDGRGTADLRLDGVCVPPLARLDRGADGPGAWPALEQAIDHATALACAEAAGTMRAVLETTRAYLQQRRQFGRPLTANQVLRHRLVDQYVDLEQARAVAGAAVARLDHAPAARRRAVSLAKAFVGPAARRCGEDGIQLHGAIGMTDEVEIGRLARRLVGFANLLGDEAWHLDRLAAT